MIQLHLKRAATVIGALSIVGLAGSSASALSRPIAGDPSSSDTGTTTNNTATTASTKTSANDQARITAIITDGNREITRRLDSLNTLSTKISGATKLSSSDKASLSTEVSTEITGLTALKTQLDGETTLSAAQADAQSIVTGYRVYALIVPKVQLIRVADDEQVTSGKLSALATKLSTRLTTAAGQGKNVTSLQSKLTDLQTQTSNAESIASGIETALIPYQPSDYNSDHSLLSGDSTKLKTAHADNVAAYNDAKAIVSGLQSL